VVILGLAAVKAAEWWPAAGFLRNGDAVAALGVSAVVVWVSVQLGRRTVDALLDRAPAGMEIAAGEYGYDVFYFQRMLAAGAVDVQQADITRCGGVTGFLQVASLCQAYSIPLSAHTAPALHTHVACAVTPFRNLEYFYDHVRIEHMLLDGLPQLSNGELHPDLSRPGFGLELKRAEAEKLAA